MNMIEIETARNLLKKRTQSTSLISRLELREILNNSDVVNSDESMDQDTTVIDQAQNTNKSDKRSPRSLSFLNTNARSLGPKITSLSDCFSEKWLDFATVTETWFQSSAGREEIEQELIHGHALGLISCKRSRVASNGRQYGGVALVFRKKTTSFERFNLQNLEDYELLAAVGKVSGVKGKVFCLSCYAPPNMAKSEATGMIEYMS